jgi:hypothetical protein
MAGIYKLDIRNFDSGRLYGFVAGRKRKESNKWDQYLIDKRDLANIIISQMKRI